MKLIIGLGNPGAQYAATRHNVGFRVVDHIASAAGWGWDGKRDRALLAQGTQGAQKIVLAKPQTYMNESGLAAGPLVRFFKVTLSDVLVICDDLDLPVGRVRLRFKGSAGGQRGMESIIAHLGSSEFARLRVGIGRPTNPHVDTVAHVLGAPQQDEAMMLAEGEARATDAAIVWALEGINSAMNRFNTLTNAPEKP